MATYFAREGTPQIQVKASQYDWIENYASAQLGPVRTPLLDPASSHFFTTGPTDSVKRASVIP